MLQLFVHLKSKPFCLQKACGEEFFSFLHSFAKSSQTGSHPLCPHQDRLYDSVFLITFCWINRPAAMWMVCHPPKSKLIGNKSRRVEDGVNTSLWSDSEHLFTTERPAWLWTSQQLPPHPASLWIFPRSPPILCLVCYSLKKTSLPSQSWESFKTLNDLTD